MKKFFNESDKVKEQSSIIELNNEVKFEDIEELFEEVDINGEEKLSEDIKEDEKIEEKKDEKKVEENKQIITNDESSNKKKKKNKNKKK
jgi:hypothetical protein